MSKQGKRYRDIVGKVDREHLYSPAEAIGLAKELASTGFDESVDVAVRLGVEVKHADQMVRGTVVLPHGTGKDVRVLVFARGEKIQEAEAAGADVVGAEELVTRIEGGWLEFDVAIATPDMMPMVGKLGRVLGPRGLMPNPKSGTVADDVAQAVSEAKAGRIEFRTERGGVVHAPIGKASFGEEQLLANFQALMDALIKARPAAAKGQYIRSVTLSTTMGPGIRVNPQQVMAAA